MIECTPKPLPQLVIGACQRLVEPQRGRLFAYLTTKSFSRRMVDRIYRERQLLEGIEVLDVILDSAGGDLGATYQLLTLFRNKCKKLRVFVPDWAKSAATFFCLGADEIWMSQGAELGPLDAQIEDPRDPNNSISALDEFRAIEFLRTYAFETLNAYIRLLREQTNMRLTNIVGEARQFVAAMMEPLYSQVDPLYFGASHRALEVAKEYGMRVMSRYSYKDWTEEQIKKLLGELTWGYPSHAYVIDYEEAKRLNLKVFLLEGNRDDDVHTILNSMKECIGFLDVEVTPPETVKKPEGKVAEDAILNRKQRIKERAKQ